MRTNTTYVAGAIGGLGLAAIAAGATIYFVGPAAQEPARRHPLFADTPGGFDPLPQFDTVRGELNFRGAECEKADDERRHILYRVCPEPYSP